MKYIDGNNNFFINEKYCLNKTSLSSLSLFFDRNST